MNDEYIIMEDLSIQHESPIFAHIPEGLSIQHESPILAHIPNILSCITLFDMKHLIRY